MRLFAAINFSGDTRARLLKLRDKVGECVQHSSLTSPDNLHLTLVFLGECDAEQTIAAKDALAATTFAPFELSIDRIGRFKRNGGDIWWAGIRADKPLLNLQQTLTTALAATGFQLERRNYSPHITLARRIISPGTKPWSIELFGETVTAIDLMKSERINGKLTYTSIEHTPAATAK